MGGSISKSVSENKLSAYIPPPRATTTTFVPPPPTFKANRVLTFRSSSRWKTYLESSKSSNKLIVVEFTASWCRPCKLIEPAFNNLSSKFTDVDFVRIDVDELMDVSNQYGIKAMPAFLFIKQGQEVDKVVGFNKEQLEGKIELHSLKLQFQY